MIQTTKCRNCRQAYEIIWDDTDVDDWKDDFEDIEDDHDFIEDSEPSDDPVYCPFCGTHCDYDE